MNGCEQLLSHGCEVPWQRFGMLHRFLRYISHKILDLLSAALDNILHIVFLGTLIQLERSEKDPRFASVLFTYFLAWVATIGTRRVKSSRGYNNFEL